jgi:putative ATP-dependent endonuclease of the OLD family
MNLSTLTIENFRCFGADADRFLLHLKPGLTALVGENDAGKSAIIDALRFVLGTTDQESLRVEADDFNASAAKKEIRICCRFSNLSAEERRAFVEHLTHEGAKAEDCSLYIHWSAMDAGKSTRRRSNIRIECRSGRNADGPSLPVECRDLLRSTYLRPLRDAERVLASGRNSRLSQVLQNTDEIKSAGVAYDPAVDQDPNTLNVMGIGDLANVLLEGQPGIANVREKINDHLSSLSLKADEVKSNIKVNGTDASEELRLRQLLEKLDLRLDGHGNAGLGSNNLLFMACELLLLAQEDEGLKLLLIEEPEAHLHAQRQLRVMKSLQEQAKSRGMQIIVSTHSPHLASAIDLSNLVIVRSRQGYSLDSTCTQLSQSDYRFLQRFLDATKANLFFANGVIIVEGDAENIVIPTIARLMGRDLAKHGVSIVNVGGVGLRRFARIFQRADEAKPLAIPVSCVTDLDVLPDCAPKLLGMLPEDGSWPELKGRKWRAKKDYQTKHDLDAEKSAKEAKASGQNVRTFVSDEWTLEYNLAVGVLDGQKSDFSGGFAQLFHIAVTLALKDNSINDGKLERAKVIEQAQAEFVTLEAATLGSDGCSKAEVIASTIYRPLANGNASKAIAAQYFSELLEEYAKSEKWSEADFTARIPAYISKAIEFATSPVPKEEAAK